MADIDVPSPLFAAKDDGRSGIAGNVAESAPVDVDESGVEIVAPPPPRSHGFGGAGMLAPD